MRHLLSGTLMVSVLSPCLRAQKPSTKAVSTPKGGSCDRYPVGSEVRSPHDLRSDKGVLKVTLRVRNSPDQNGHMSYCYLDEHGNQAPTLRVQPGDTLIVNLKNEISLPDSPAANGKTERHTSKGQREACGDGQMNPSSTNLHFHGLAVPAVCHQDETLKTAIEAGGRPFQYRIHIPEKQPPGLYWYHPHIHGFSEDQVLGGASGALIVEGVERVSPRVAGLPERVLVIRDEAVADLSPSANSDLNRPTKELSVNYTPVPYPQYPPAVIKMRPSQREFWRVLNGSADTYLDLSVEFGGKKQTLSIVSLDGVPVGFGLGNPEADLLQQFHIFLPPGARSEFLVTGPPQGSSGLLVTGYVNRGAGDETGAPVPVNKMQPGTRAGQDDIDPRRPLAVLQAAPEVPVPSSVRPIAGGSFTGTNTPPLTSIRAVRKRTLYFSEQLSIPGDATSSTLFFITEEGHAPAVFDPEAEPAIHVHQGDVEDWTIENRSRESHDFHVHQLHFVVVGSQGVPWEQPALRDTINLPAWDGFHRYPSVTVRMDFRDPQIVGTFPFHCHILQHIDGGMMGTIQVEPANKRGSRQVGPDR